MVENLDAQKYVHFRLLQMHIHLRPDGIVETVFQIHIKAHQYQQLHAMMTK